jgi:hypothetical protein
LELVAAPLLTTSAADLAPTMVESAKQSDRNSNKMYFNQKFFK